jgi:peptidoglycan/LPS O-acetylase OafA/YrhL
MAPQAELAPELLHPALEAGTGAGPVSGSATEPEPTPAAPPVRRSRLPALTGLRAFAACNLVFFHFSDPHWFGPFAPIIDNGYTAVSFFLLLSGFILAYNYSERARNGEMVHWKFWVARFSRLYPIYLVALLLSWQMLRDEYHVRPHAQFVQGVVLTPLLLQGWVPALSTFWNTPAWTMSTEAFFYMLFPFAAILLRPRSWPGLLALLALLWVAGMTLPTLYIHFHPDGDLHPGRYTDGFWIRALKFSPPPHLPSFLFGMVLADVDARIPRAGWQRLLLGAIGVAGTYAVLDRGAQISYVLMHDGLLMPLFGCAILGLAGKNLLARFFGFAGFVAFGQTSYCLYILHFNLWEMIHNSGLLEKTGLIRLDPWFSYGLLAAAAGAALVLVERPMQKRIRRMIA